MRILIILLFLLGIKFCPQAAWGQNLIPNYSFEDTLTCFPTEWTNANQGSPDYFANCNPIIGEPGGFFSKGVPLNFVGNQYPKSGIAYMGLAIYVFDGAPKLREYLQAHLKKALKKDSTYCLQFYISLADSCQMATKKQFGIYFSTNAISSNNAEVLNYTPQIIVSPTTYIIDKVNWLEYNFQYTAQGGEQYMTMGNFRSYNNGDTLVLQDGGKSSYFKYTYYYIDNVWLSHCDSVPKHYDVAINSNIHEIPCYTDSTILNLKIKNISVDSIDFTIDTLAIFTEILQNGSVVQSFQQEIADNTLNYKGNLLGQDSSISIQLNPINLSQLGQAYQIKVYARLKPDEDTTNNVLDTILINNLSLGNVIVSYSSICAGTTIELISENSYGEPQWQYSSNQMDWITLNNDTIATHQPLQTSFYRFVICDFYYSDTLKVEVNNPPKPNDINLLFCKSLESFIIPSKQNNVQNFNWYKSPTEVSPFYAGDTLSSQFFQNQTYYLESMIDSCVSLEKGKVAITIDNCPINIPNIFTPNGDGFNDFFLYSDDNGILTDSTISTTIFNRWGNEVAAWQGNIPWDGGNLEDGTYYYVVIADGVEYKGSVVILR